MPYIRFLENYDGVSEKVLLDFMRDHADAYPKYFLGYDGNRRKCLEQTLKDFSGVLKRRNLVVVITPWNEFKIERVEA